MSTVISAKGLSKKHIISHEVQGAYSTIVDSVTKATKRFYRRLTQPFRKRTPPQITHEVFWALDDVSFECEEGDRLGIIGRNGAGKSTLLKILSRIVEPTAGFFKIRGRVASLLEVGTGFHPELTGRENIFLNGAILGMGRREILKKFSEIVSFAEIEKFLDTPVKYYSSGMYARLGFAIAAHLDPDILIVDEVLAVGDAQFQAKCLNKMEAASQQGRTILFVSHSTQSMLSLCNKGILLEKGKIKEQGPIEKCINTYLQQTQTMKFAWKGSVGDEHAKIHSVELEQTNDFFYRGEIVTLNIECEILAPLKEELLGIEIKNSFQQTVLHSYLNTQDHVRKCLQTPGKYIFSLELDTGILWEGEYVLHLNYFIPDKRRILHDEIRLRFPIYPSSEEKIFTNTNGFSGILYPFTWKMQNAKQELIWQR